MIAPILYLAGPIAGVEHYAENFDGVDYALRQEGYETRNPARWGCGTPTPLRITALGLGADARSWHDFMRRAVETLTRVDGVALLDGWEDSRGATWEQRIATEVLALPCLPAAGWVELGGLMP